MPLCPRLDPSMLSFPQSESKVEFCLVTTYGLGVSHTCSVPTHQISPFCWVQVTAIEWQYPTLILAFQSCNYLVIPNSCIL